MSFFKRAFSSLCAFAVMALGVFSFSPVSYSVSDYEFPFPVTEIPSNPDPSGYPYSVIFATRYQSTYHLRVYYSSHPIVLDSSKKMTFSPSALTYIWSSSSGSWSSSLTSSVQFANSISFGSPFPFSSSGFTNNSSLSTSFTYEFLETPISSIPKYWDYQPFFFPEMPHGYFDGNINVVDGSYNIDFPSNASIDGSMTVVPGGGDQYTWTWNNGSVYWYGDTVQGEHEGWLSPTYQGQTPPSGTVTGTIVANRDISLSLENFDSVVTYTPAYNENSRFRCWSCVMDSSYVWFVSDTRNKITGSIVSVTSDEVTWKYEFSDPQGGNTIYPTWAIVFSPMGEVIQVLSPTTVSNKNTYTLSCSIGTLQQDSDTGIWSCDPLYHGFWFSNDSPTVANITYLNVAENKKYLANPVFGESAFQLQFLSSINDNLTGLRSDLASLQSAMTSSISNQTSTFQNMDAASNFDPTDVQNMLDYGSLESNYHAPSTDQLFSVSGGTYTDGMAFWRDRMNELLYYSGSPILGLTTFVMTLGLAALVIGRRISGGGTA